MPRALAIDGCEPSSGDGAGVSARAWPTRAAAVTAASSAASTKGSATAASAQSAVAAPTAGSPGTVATSPTQGDAARTAIATRRAPSAGSAASMMQTSKPPVLAARVASVSEPEAVACPPILQSHWAIAEAVRRSSSTTRMREAWGRADWQRSRMGTPGEVAAAFEPQSP